MIEMQVGRIVIRDFSRQQYIYLREKDGERGFPIVIGLGEAAEIRRVIAKEVLERPLTHELALNIAEALGAQVERVDIVDLRNNTFFAQLVLIDPEGHQVAVVDCRPSDAIALALRAKRPIRVAESVLEQVRTDQAQDELPPPEPEAED